MFCYVEMIPTYELTVDICIYVSMHGMLVCKFYIRTPKAHHRCYHHFIPKLPQAKESILRISAVQTSAVHSRCALGPHRSQRLQLHGPVLPALPCRLSRPGDQDLRCGPVGEEVGAGASGPPAFTPQGRGSKRRSTLIETVSRLFQIVFGCEVRFETVSALSAGPSAGHQQGQQQDLGCDLGRARATGFGRRGLGFPSGHCGSLRHRGWRDRSLRALRPRPCRCMRLPKAREGRA